MVTLEPLPAGPVAPVGPAGPVAPTLPAGPATPAGPVGPVAPAGPVAPTLPDGPATPATPATPALPATPAGPATRPRSRIAAYAVPLFDAVAELPAARVVTVPIWSVPETTVAFPGDTVPRATLTAPPLPTVAV